MKYSSFKYALSGNVGDNVQSLAAEQHLPANDCRLDRDFLSSACVDQQTLLIMNGWFSQSPRTALPPTSNILPVFFGFHIHRAFKDFLLTKETIAYLKAREPIGCRDVGTCEILADLGIEAFYSKCLTLTFPRRTQEPVNGEVFVVDAHGIPLPPHLRENAVQVSQIVTHVLSDDTKRQIARELLDSYKTRAKLVITTKLHCAMPCVAMGIPVVFFGDPKDYRLAILKDIGIPIHHYAFPKSQFLKTLNKASIQLKGPRQDIDWNPAPINLETEKAAMVHKLKQMVASVVEGANRQ